VLLLLVVLAGRDFAADLFTPARDLAVLRDERALLAAEVERLQTELALETATRRELERHAADSNARVAELNGQVEFLRARRAPGKSTE
jgi:chromosome segregation ATPase